MSNAKKARELAHDKPATAQVYALLAIAEAIDNWKPPGEPEPEPVPFEQTKEGWKW